MSIDDSTSRVVRRSNVNGADPNGADPPLVRCSRRVVGRSATQPRMIKRLCALLVALLGLGLLLATSASAHTSVLSSDPADGARLTAAPRSVTLVFNEDVGLGGVGYLHVTDQAGTRVDARAAAHPGGDGTRVTVTLRAGLGDGTYTASFRVVSADSHPVTGTIRFVVGGGPVARGTASAGPTTNGDTSFLFSISRWISFAGLALLGGLWLVLTVWPAGRGDRRARRIVWAGWAGLVAGAGLELLLQGPYTAGVGPRVLDRSLLHDTLGTTYGQLHSARLLLLAALGVLLARSLRAPRRARWDAVLGVLGVGVLWTFSDSGHGATTSPAWLSVPIDMLHLAAMATWLGGLVMLLGAVLPRREPEHLRTVLPVFSTAAFGAVLVLVGTGTYSAWRGVGTVDALFSTTYGLLVLGKVLLLAAIVAVANVSRRVVRRRVVAYAMTDVLMPDAPAADQQDVRRAPIQTKRLRRAVYVETVIAFVVLALSALLVTQPRGKEALIASYRQPISATASLGAGRSVTVTADTATHGPVSVTVEVSTGAAPQSITATAVQKKAQLGPLPITLTRAGSGVYEGSATLAVSGTWDIDLVVTTSALDATNTDVELALH
jgi:copper transport protein